MSRSPLTFRQRDVRAALRAARAEGEKIAGFKIAPDGTIEVIFAGNAIPQAEPKNVWDEDAAA